MLPDGFATDRLMVRPWGADFANPMRRRALERALGGILTAPVLQHLPEPLRPEGQGLGDWIAARAAESDVFLASKAGTDAPIGLLIVAAGTAQTDRADRHVGYLLAETVWGRGYATELVSGLVRAVEGNGPARLIGGVGTGNAALARVLEKAGFRRSPALSSPETDMFVIRIG